MKGPSIIFACLISRAHFIVPPLPPQSQSQLRVALPSSRTQICWGTVTSHPAFRFSRHALITGVPGERDEWQEKGRKKKERKRKREIVLAYAYAAVAVVVYACTFMLRGHIHETDTIAEEYGVRGAFQRMPAPIEDSGMRNCDRVTRACAHNAPRPAALYCAPRQKHAKYRDEFGADFRVNDQRKYTRGLRIFDSSKNVSVNTGELQTRRAMHSPEYIRKLNAPKLNLFFSQDDLLPYL